MRQSPQLEQLNQELLQFSPPNLEHDRLAETLHREYGLSGRFVALAGERDQNIRVRTDAGPDYLLKVASPTESLASIDFQISALNHLTAVDPDLPVPRNIPTLSGAPTASVANPEQGASYNLRLLTFVAGRPIVSADQLIPAFIGQTGDLMGRLNAAFQGYDHPAGGHVMPWNILNGLVTDRFLVEACLPETLRADCVSALTRMSHSSFTRMLALPASVIHNDAHTGNILVDPETGTHVVGLIDFGDMVQGPLVQDVGSTLSSFAETCPDLVGMSVGYIRALSRHISFSDEEVALVFDAMLARLILTVQLTQFRILHSGTGSPHIVGTDLPRVIETLSKVLAHDRGQFTRSLRDALGR